MTEAEYSAARAAVLRGEDPPAALLDDCLRSVRLLIRNAGLPAHYSPYGVWSPEAIEEVYADWVAVRLVARGQLRAMLQRAPVLRVFRRMSETSVRQHLVDRLGPSQAANLYQRINDLLADERFIGTGSGTGKLWRLASGPGTPFDGDDRRLLAVAWSLGDFRVIRYDLEARKLSPLLATEDLDRFVVGMLGAGATTVGSLVHAVRLRFGVEDEEPTGELDDAQHAVAGGSAPDRVPIIDELVTATLAELSERQAKILMGRDRGVTGGDLAVQLGCSTGTISHELRRIEELLAHIGTDAPEVLKHVLDALFGDNA